MKEKKTLIKNPTTRFSVHCYLWFWLGLTVVIAVALLAGTDSPIVQVCSVLTSWTPTVVVLCLLPSLLPGKDRKEWVRSQFSAEINVVLMIVPMAVIALISFGALYVSQGMALDADKLSAILRPQTVAMLIPTTLLSGALGEELGWRGYLQQAFEEKNGGKVILSALKVGVIWSFWHTPLWLITSGLPMDLLPKYVAGFIAANVSISVVMAVCFACCRNLVIPMWIHFCFNILSNIVMGWFNLETELAAMVDWWCIAAMFDVVAALIVASCWLRRERSRKLGLRAE